LRNTTLFRYNTARTAWYQKAGELQADRGAATKLDFCRKKQAKTNLHQLGRYFDAAFSGRQMSCESLSVKGREKTNELLQQKAVNKADEKGEPQIVFHDFRCATLFRSNSAITAVNHRGGPY